MDLISDPSAVASHVTVAPETVGTPQVLAFSDDVHTAARSMFSPAALSTVISAVAHADAVSS